MSANTELERILDSIALATMRQKSTDFAWLGERPEDRFAAEEHMTALYAKMGLAKPRFSWAMSPAGLSEAMHMMRTMQQRGKHEMVKALIQTGNIVELEGRRTFLNAVLDPDITVNIGADLTTEMNWRTLLRWTRYREMQSLTDLKRVLRDDLVYSSLYRELIGHIAFQSFAVKPYARLCWFVLPPKYIRVNDEGYLHCNDGPAIEWRDGFAIYHQHEEPQYLPEPEDTVEIAGRKTLTHAGTMKALMQENPELPEIEVSDDDLEG